MLYRKQNITPRFLGRKHLRLCTNCGCKTHQRRAHCNGPFLRQRVLAKRLVLLDLKSKSATEFARSPPINLVEGEIRIVPAERMKEGKEH